MQNDPIFIVGIARSGTTLLAAMLAAHSRMSCGPETHFFRWLTKNSVEQILDKQNWPGPAGDFICSIKQPGFSGNQDMSLIDRYLLDEQSIQSYLENKDPSIVNILSSITEQYMVAMGKQRWVEKTPDHIMYLGLIRKYFPASPIIRILRDPRDVAISLTKLPWGVKSFLEGVLYWKSVDETSERFFSTDSNCYTILYEDLIFSPKEELRKLCRFIGEEFEDEMLDTSATGKRVNSMNVPWKEKASQPVDSSRVYAWRKELTLRQNQMAESLIGDRLSAYGYPTEANFSRLGEIYPATKLIVKYGDAFESLTASGARFWKILDHERPSVTIYLGDPSGENWFKYNNKGKLLTTLSISMGIIKNHLNHNLIYWIPDQYAEMRTGYSAFILKKLLAPNKVAVDISNMSSNW